MHQALFLKRCFTLMLFSLVGFVSLPAKASIIITGTRVIYPAQQREVTIKMNNEDQKFPRLVQAWIDDGHEKISVDKMEVPFTLTPPIFRMEAGKSQSIRMVYTKEPLATDKETLFWLNVLEVPPKVGDEDDNQLRFAFRLRTKIFFRPAKLASTSQQARDTLQWSLVKEGSRQLLEVRNPSPYYVSFQSVALALGEKIIHSDEYEMVAPEGTQRFSLKNVPANVGTDAKVKFAIVDDSGAFVPVVADLSSGKTATVAK